MADPRDFQTLVDALQRSPASFGDGVARVERLETHISVVLLAGDFAWKLKKPVNFGFLDFSTLERRRRFCEEELRLNARLAPELYLDVVPITGTFDAPRLGGDGPAIEHAVRMRRFPQEALLSRVLADGRLHPSHIDRLAHEVADFHGRVAVAPADSRFGTPEAVLAPVEENFRHLVPIVSADAALAAAVESLRDWSRRAHAGIAPVVAERRNGGFVRECHGDMHLGNMVLRDDGSIAIFDGIEFNESLRWTDVAAETAFVTMDLADRGRRDLSHRFLNAYLELTGDYGQLHVLSFYQAYRAMVRAKVAGLRMRQPGVGDDDAQAADREMRGYVRLAEELTRPLPTAVILTRGLTGSGKTTCSQFVAEACGAVRVRSDVERKRLFGMKPHERSHSGLGTGLYTIEASRRTFARLAEIVRVIVESGRPALVDAAFLHRSTRDDFRRLAEELAVPWVVLECEAPDDVLRERVAAREKAGTDASEASLEVLQMQIDNRQPLAPDELPHAITVDTTRFDADALVCEVASRCRKGQAGGIWRRSGSGGT